MMKRLLGVSAALAILSACGGATDTSSDQSASALSNPSATGDAAGAGDLKAQATACLTTYAQCVRDGTDTATCREALRACMPKPPRPPRGDHDGDCKDRPPPPPPPPPPGADGSSPPPPPPPPAIAACLDALDTCAKGTEAIETCVDTALACLPPPPPPPPRGDRDGDGDRPPPPPPPPAP